MTDVFYGGLSWSHGSKQVTPKSALAEKARSKNVRKACLKRALTAACSELSCAGHVSKNVDFEVNFTTEGIVP